MMEILKGNIYFILSVLTCICFLPTGTSCKFQALWPGHNFPLCFMCSLKCLCDQIFGIPNFYLFVKSMTFLLNLPNFKSLRAWKVTFSDGFYTRLYGRH